MTSLLDEITKPAVTDRTSFVVGCARAITRNSGSRGGELAIEQRAYRAVCVGATWGLIDPCHMAPKVYGRLVNDIVECSMLMHRGLLR